MKDKIKEILNRFDFVKKEPNKLSYYPEDLLTREEMWLLYDYITNLQEENKNLKLSLKNRIKYSEELDEKTLRIEKAIEKLESIRVFGLSSGKTLFSTLINETIDILKGDKDE